MIEISNEIMSVAQFRAILRLWFLTEKFFSGADTALLLVIWVEVETVLQSVASVPELAWAVWVK